MTVTELDALRRSGAPHALLDVRQPEETEIASIGGTLIPLAELAARLGDVPDARGGPLVVLCRSGVRSANAVSFLRANGFANAVNLEGGILAWSDRVDPTVQRY